MVKIFGFEIKRTRTTNHKLTNEDQERGRSTQAMNRQMKLLEDEIKHREMMIRLRRQKEILEEMEDDYYGDDDDDEDSDDPDDRSVLDKIFEQKMMDIMNIPHTTQNSNNVTQTYKDKTDLSDDEINDFLDQTSPDLIAAFLKLPSKMQDARIRTEMPQIGRSTLSRIKCLAKEKNRS